MIKVAVVILNWNGINYLKKFLPGVIQYTNNPDYSVFVADNGSTDGSVDYLKTVLPKDRIFSFNRNYGFALGYKKALALIESEYYVLLNSDVEVTHNWITPVIQIMDNDKRIAACMPKIRSFYNRDDFEYAGSAGGFIDKYGYPFCRGRILNQIEQDKGQYDDMIHIFWATGACLFLRSSSYNDVNGLDGDFFAHMEEIDLCWRLQLKGYKIIYVPDVLVYHVGGGTLPNNSPGKLYLNFRNNLYLLYKNLPDKVLNRILVKRLLLDGMAALIYFCTFSFAFGFAIVRAHFDFFRHIKHLKVKRGHMQKYLRYDPGFQTVFKSSLLVHFFIKRNKTFSHMGMKTQKYKVDTKKFDSM